MTAVRDLSLVALTSCASAAGPAEARAYLEESTVRGPRHMAPTAASAGYTATVLDTRTFLIRSSSRASATPA
jgi:hypothetical protein